MRRWPHVYPLWKLTWATSKDQRRGSALYDRLEQTVRVLPVLWRYEEDEEEADERRIANKRTREKEEDVRGWLRLCRHLQGLVYNTNHPSGETLRTWAKPPSRITPKVVPRAPAGGQLWPHVFRTRSPHQFSSSLKSSAFLSVKSAFLKTERSCGDLQIDTQSSRLKYVNKSVNHHLGWWKLSFKGNQPNHKPPGHDQSGSRGQF